MKIEAYKVQALAGKPNFTEVFTINPPIHKAYTPDCINGVESIDRLNFYLTI